ncbi:MAG: EsaB/YukD family protein [Bacillota bacterium]|uniref:EsaB/YukD family protein n=1 Tax=Virgibacillus salarius TaxID=447199 RepID=UPI002491BD22|nr:EsaB/YukD family protein [Virgibacillus salarius]WBX79781.1 EsaB/YukD family protein [Virgibacillus salarius]
MYIHVTVDIERYHQENIELRLSDQFMIKQLIDITWQAKQIEGKPREGHWIRVKNKERVYNGGLTLQACGITTGDCIEIL